jgi:hypothetical protein
MATFVASCIELTAQSTTWSIWVHGMLSAGRGHIGWAGERRAHNTAPLKLELDVACLYWGGAACEMGSGGLGKSEQVGQVYAESYVDVKGGRKEQGHCD